MSRLRYRSACVGIGALVSALLAGDAVAEEAPLLTASMQCDRAVEPGRVKCSIETKAAGNRAIAWADVALLELPEFMAALKGRIGPGDAVFRDGASQKWAFGLVARKAGSGEARALVRALVCEPGTVDAGVPRCAPATIDVRAVVRVG